jgi:hypothetical protein
MGSKVTNKHQGMNPDNALLKFGILKLAAVPNNAGLAIL